MLNLTFIRFLLTFRRMNTQTALNQPTNKLSPLITIYNLFMQHLLPFIFLSKNFLLFTIRHFYSGSTTYPIKTTFSTR